MLPETNEPTTPPEHSPDLFAEPRDHANQWDVTALWPDREPPPQDENPSRANPAPAAE